jgi:hypothetical protein
MNYPEISIPFWAIVLFAIIVSLAVSIPLLIITMAVRIIMRNWAADRPLVAWPAGRVAKVIVLSSAAATFVGMFPMADAALSIRWGVVAIVVASIGISLIVLVPTRSEVPEDDFPY